MALETFGSFHSCKHRVYMTSPYVCDQSNGNERDLLDQGVDRSDLARGFQVLRTNIYRDQS
jgi:uncharacterized Zn finger protein